MGTRNPLYGQDSRGGRMLIVSSNGIYRLHSEDGHKLLISKDGRQLGTVNIMKMNYLQNMVYIEYSEPGHNKSTRPIFIRDVMALVSSKE